MSYEVILKKLISSINHPLKSGLDLELALKSKLTKKELKLLKLLAQGLNKPQIQEQLAFDDIEYNRVESNLVKKINQEKTKQALYDL